MNKKNNNKKEFIAVPMVKNETEEKAALEKTLVEIKEEKKDMETIVKEAETLKKNMEEEKKRLDKCLEELEEKQRIYSQRSRFIEVVDGLKKVEKDLEEEADFDSQDYKVSFFGGRYSRNPEFSISNRAVIQDFVNFTMQRIEQRLKELEDKLMA